MNEAGIGTILIVDDEEELKFVLCAHLRHAGYHVYTAGNGAEAIETARREQPDVIVMDVNMPVMDGLTATRRLKEDPATAHIPVIMLTARTRTEDLVRGLEAGAQEYLAKPFDMLEILARVRTVHRLATSRRQIEELNRRLESEVREKTHRLQVLYDYMRALNQATTRDEILDLIVRCARDATGSERISLMMADNRGESLICERALGIERSLVRRIRVGAGEGVAGRVFQSGKTVVAKTVCDEDTPSGRHAYTSDTFLSTPLVTASLASHGEVLGVLNVTEKASPGAFSEHEIECIRSIADAGAIALNHLERRRRLQESVLVLLRTIGRLSEYRDDETSLHLERVARYARLLAQRLLDDGAFRGQINEEFVEMIELAAPMHDIGKIGIPDDVLTKPGALTDEEFDLMKTHTEIGFRVLSMAMEGTAGGAPLLRMCSDIAYAHHERYDGRGYPRGLSADEIPLAARIVALADAYDAITSVRRYKEAASHEQAVERIRRDSGKHFDPVIVRAFLDGDRQFDEIRRRHADRESRLEAVSV
ncbi:MAG: Chemotaxis response regulator protein-glutamate methylesterase [Phycisphaerae bacterium]|nr:Chemotaxis response regulator protein-glutamate methylesterase [Phycisphaerae bacterium]